MKIYKDPLSSNGYLVGYKGDSCMDSGYIYAPYVPVYRTPVVFDPNQLSLNETDQSCVTSIGESSKKRRCITDEWEISRFD